MTQPKNSKELVASALRGEAVPRPPTGPLAVHFCAGVAGLSVRQYTTSAQLMAEAVMRYYERFHPDAVWLSADTWVSAEAMGARVGATGDEQPSAAWAIPPCAPPRTWTASPRPTPAGTGATR